MVNYKTLALIIKHFKANNNEYCNFYFKIVYHRTEENSYDQLRKGSLGTETE